MPNTPKFPAWMWPALIATLVLALVAGAFRLRSESRAKAVAILVESSAVGDLAQGAMVDRNVVLGRLREAGATGVVLTEQTIGQMIDEARLRMEGRDLVSADQTAARQLFFAIEARLGRGAVPQDGSRALGRFRLPDGMDLGFLRKVSGGPNPDEAKAVADAKLSLGVRIQNETAAGPDYFRAILARAAEVGASVIVPIGEQAPGQRELIKDVAAQMEVLGLEYGSPEFAKIAGDAALSARMQDRLLRLHAVQSVEIDKLTRPELVERFVRAYRERNIRLLLLRPVGGASPDPIGDFVSVIGDVRAGIEKVGGTIKWPTPMADPGIPMPLFAALGVAAATVVLAIGVAMVPPGWLRWLGVLIVIALAASSVTGAGRVFLATVVAFVFPIGGYVLLESRHRINPWREFMLMTAFSVVGGLAVAGLLSELSFMVRIDQFFAVKLAHFGPILVVAAWMIARRVDVAALWRLPVLWGVAITVLVMLAAVLFMVARTGNDNPAAVSDTELRFRAILDAVLYVRPRTKEFLIGHPAALLGLFLMARSRADGASLAREGWAVGLLTLGAIGQTSIVNTLCHLHSPLDLNLIRIATGLLLGGILGLILWKLLQPRLAPSPR